jgi:hypothetical protein
MEKINNTLVISKTEAIKLINKLSEGLSKNIEFSTISFPVIDTTEKDKPFASKQIFKIENKD